MLSVTRITVSQHGPGLGRGQDVDASRVETVAAGTRTAHPDSVNITDAQPGSSADLRSREKRYGITMAFRVACFIAMIWVPSPYRWVLLVAAAVLPYVAVIFANQADQRRQQPPFERGGPSDRPELTEQKTSFSNTSAMTSTWDTWDTSATSQPEAPDTESRRGNVVSTSSMSSHFTKPHDPTDVEESAGQTRNTRRSRG